MEYTINKVAQLSGVSKRTLRYYDGINLLKPQRINSSGYRIYRQKQIDLLHQILLYRDLELSLDEIKQIINNPNFDEHEALKDHRKKLLLKSEQINRLIKNVENTLLSKKGEIIMTNEQKFEDFKQNLLKENEDKYGDEIRQKYDNDTIQKSNKQFANMSESEYKAFEKLNKDMFELLTQAMEQTNDPTSNPAQKAAELHKQWITDAWGHYNPEAHGNLVQMYVDDERFKKYYDDVKEGAAEFLRDAVLILINDKGIEITMIEQNK